MSYARYVDAEQRINQGLIRRNLSLEREGHPPRDPLAKMAEMRSFLDELGNPGFGIPIVHVAGTSGKGSVAAATAGILSEAGLKVGLHVSPYLQVATEKIWIDRKLVSGDVFAALVDWVLPVAKSRVRAETPASIHGMASVAIALEAFRRRSVDVIVFEAGAGGRFDLSNVLPTSVSVVTNVGLDHVVSLGPSLEQIAWHKSGIARPNTPLITGATGTPLDVIRNEAETIGAPMTVIAPSENPLLQNLALAEAASGKALELLGMSRHERTSRAGIDSVRLPGRTEMMPCDRPLVILDGAHNPEKISVAVAAALARASSGPKVCLLGLLGAKAGPNTVAPLKGRFDRVVVTEPVVYAKKSCPAEVTAGLLSDIGYRPVVARDEADALNVAMSLAGDRGTVVVTGSFYLVGNLRDRWYPRETVVRQCTSFPEAAPP